MSVAVTILIIVGIFISIFAGLSIFMDAGLKGGKWAKRRDTTIGLILILGPIVAMFAADIYADYQIDKNQRQECAELNAEFVRGTHDSWCITRDGRIVKVF